MSTISLAKPKSGAVTNVWPQVDLLPPEVRAGRKLRRTKLLLVLAVLVVVLLAMLGWVYAKFTLADANQQVADAQTETARLTQEQAKYSEVPQIQAQLKRAHDAIASATATEVLWKQYLEAIRAVTPEAVSYDSMQVTVSNDPNPQVSGDPLQAPSIGQIVFTARAATIPDLAAWMDAVSAIPGLSDPWFQQAQITDKDGHVYYQVTGSVQINDVALAHRFDAPLDDSSAPSSPATAPSSTPSATPTGGNS